MTLPQQILTIFVVILGTMLTRFLPFLIFPEGKKTPAYIVYLGAYLPYAGIGLLVVYSMKDAFITIPTTFFQLIAILLTVLMHKWKHNTLLSIGAGTALYMFLLQTFS